MRRPSREFKAEPSDLEGRWLLAIGHASIPVNEYVQFKQTMVPQLTQGTGPPTQVVGQQDGEANVVLTRSDNRGRLQVRVTTDPSSPAVGVNVGAMDQTVTFPNLQPEVAVRVPILAGAPNPGEVDVNLSLTPVTPRVTTSGPLELRILASDAAIPPKIVSVEGKPHSIVLTFNKPMNPVGASDVKNYAATWTSIHYKHDALGLLALAVPSWWYDSSTSSGSVSLRAARYDPATNSVTLITGRTIDYARASGITVSARTNGIALPAPTNGIPVSAQTNTTTVFQRHPAKNPGRTGDPSGLRQGLTDLDGNPINADTTPGSFSNYVFKGLHPTN